jgi:hypothetical protein
MKSRRSCLGSFFWRVAQVNLEVLPGPQPAFIGLAMEWIARAELGTCCVLPTTVILALVIHCTKMRNSWGGDDPVGGSPCVLLATQVSRSQSLDSPRKKSVARAHPTLTSITHIPLSYL